MCYFLVQMLMKTCDSAKELEHYQRVRQTFEGPAKPKQLPNQYLPATAPAKQQLPVRPKYKSRTGTAIKYQPKAVAESKDKGKGKGKAPTKGTNSSDSYNSSSDDDDAYVTSNDFSSPSWGATEKATKIPRPVDGFRDAAEGDDDIYS